MRIKSAIFLAMILILYGKMLKKKKKKRLSTWDVISSLEEECGVEWSEEGFGWWDFRIFCFLSWERKVKKV